MTKEETLASLRELAATGQVSREEVEPLFAVAAPLKKSHQKISQIFSYIGGLIVLIGIVVLVAQNWINLGLYGRIVVTAGSALLFFALGGMALNTEKFYNAGLAFISLAAALAPVGWFVTLAGYGVWLTTSLSNLIIASMMAFIFLLTFAAVRHAVPLLLSVIFLTWAGWSATFYLLHLSGFTEISMVVKYLILISGVCYMLLGYALSQSPYAKAQSFLYFFGVPALLGAALTLSGWDMFGRDRSFINVWELAYPFLAVGVTLLSIRLKSRSCLLFGSLFIVLYIFKITSKYFAETFGWPVVLVLVGLAFVGVGYGVLYLNRNYLKVQ